MSGLGEDSMSAHCMLFDMDHADSDTDMDISQVQNRKIGWMTVNRKVLVQSWCPNQRSIN